MDSLSKSQPHLEEPKEASGDSIAHITQSLEEAVARLKVENKENTAAAKELAKLAKPTVLYNLKNLEKAYTKARQKIPAEVEQRCGLEPLLRIVDGYVRVAPRLLRQELGAGLKRICQERGYQFRVVSREEPLEVRIAPLSIIIDFKTSKATLRFARDPLQTCNLEAEAILKAYEKAVATLDSAFDAPSFFEQCRNAYLRVLRLEGLPDGHRLELLRFLPELAYLKQPKRFQENPVAKNYRSYSRAQFAYDVLRLRKAGELSRGGSRINFGVATGTTASKKSRVIYMEDEQGVGEYKLTLFFTRG